jgi:hypothetical protein
MTAMKQFPNVDPDQIEGAGHSYQQAAAELTSAAGRVRATAGTHSWTSSSARPAWDSTLAARTADISNAHEVMTHIGNVLRMTGAELARAKSRYQSVQLNILLFDPDPRAGSETSLGGLLSPDPKPVDPQALAAYEAQVRKANQAVDDAEYVLALCARELLSVSEGVAFAPMPSGAPTAVDPKTFAIIPLAPAFGAPSGAIYANGVPIQFVRGQKFEAQILRQLGISDQAKQFFRPNADGEYELPRTKTGLYRGTFPDSMRAGLLEIKSGQTEISMNMPQIQVQRFIAEKLGIPWNLITERDTPVDPEVIDGIRASGGSIYSPEPGDDGVYYDRLNDQYVRLSGGTGPTASDLQVDPLTPDETAAMQSQIAANERLEHNLGGLGGGNDPPTVEGPSQPYVTEQQYDDAWANANVSPDGDTPLPGTPEEQTPGGTLEPGDPLPVEPEPIEPLPIDPDDFIP